MTNNADDQSKETMSGDILEKPMRRGAVPVRQSRRLLPEPLFIVRAELRRLVPYSMQHILRLEKRGQFPARVTIGTNRVAWVRSEVMSWIDTRMRQRQVGQGVK